MTATEDLLALLDGSTVRAPDFTEKALALVLYHGADPMIFNTAGEQHYSLLHILVLNNTDQQNDQAITQLIAHNKDTVNNRFTTITSDTYPTPIQALLSSYENRKISFRHLKLTGMLLATHGADIQSYGHTKLRLFHLLVVSQYPRSTNPFVSINLHKEIDDLMACYPTILHSKDDNGFMPVFSLLESNPAIDLAVLKKFLPEKKCFLAEEAGAYSLVHLACRLGRLDILNYFQSQGLSLTNKTLIDEDSLLHSAAESSSKELVLHLLKSGEIDVDARNFAQTTPLMRAFIRGSETHDSLWVINLLIRHGANIQAKNSVYTMLGCATHAHDNGKGKTYLGLLQKIQAMHDYGSKLQQQGHSKGVVGIRLAQELKDLMLDFFDQERARRDYLGFKRDFVAKLHSKDSDMNCNRIAWATIVENIAIALTGVGVFFLAAQLIHSRATKGQPLFFFQKPQTTSKKIINEFDNELRDWDDAFVVDIRRNASGLH